MVCSILWGVQNIKELFLDIPLSVGLNCPMGVIFPSRVWVHNRGALRIIASVSLKHIPCLFACFYEAVSCAYAFFSTYLSTCVARSACFVFCSVFITIFLFSFFFSYKFNDTYVTVPIDVRITLLICLSSVSICIFMSLIPAYVYLNM